MMMWSIMMTTLDALKVPEYKLPSGVHYQQALPEIVRQRKKQIERLIERLKSLADYNSFQKLVSQDPTLYLHMEDRCRKLSNLLEMPIVDIVFLQYTYQLLAFKTMCTSFAVSSTDSAFLGRNLDYYFPQDFRDISVKLIYMRNGVVHYQTLQHIGYLGVNTGLSAQGFAVSLNQRETSTLASNLDNLAKGYSRSIQLIEQSLQTDSFEQALSKLTKNKIIAPSFFLIAKHSNITLLARSSQRLDDLIQSASIAVQGNKQIGEPDDKITVGTALLQSKSKNNCIQALQSKPIKNEMTVLSVLADLTGGSFQIWMESESSE